MQHNTTHNNTTQAQGTLVGGRDRENRNTAVGGCAGGGIGCSFSPPASCCAVLCCAAAPLPLPLPSLCQVTGGYGGVMEAVSVGASSVAGSSIEGILSPAAFPSQSETGNGHLTHRTYTADLPHRIIAFLARCQAFVALPGGLGTLTELCLTWNTAAVSQLQATHSSRPMCLLADRQPWEALLGRCRQLLPITEQFMAHVTFVDSVDDILSRLHEARTQQQRLTATPAGGSGGHQPATEASADTAVREGGADEKSHW